VWGDTRVALPAAAQPRRFRDVFTGVTIEPDQHDGALTIPAAKLFASFPVALLARSEAK
jgi:maltooligosyltrehalose synthase